MNVGDIIDSSYTGDEPPMGSVLAGISLTAFVMLREGNLWQFTLSDGVARWDEVRRIIKIPLTVLRWGTK